MAKYLIFILVGYFLGLGSGITIGLSIMSKSKARKGNG